MKKKMKCTWKDCTEEAIYPLLDKNGNQWAKLCEKHYNEHERAMDRFMEGGGPKKMLSAWVKAQGGAKAAADRF